MRVAGLRVWLGLKGMMVLAAVHLAYMASSHIKGASGAGRWAVGDLGLSGTRRVLW